MFYDIGANFGYYSVKYGSLCSGVYCFEPVKTTFDYLGKDIFENKIKNARVFNFGLSDAKGSIEINLYSASGCNSIYRRNIPEGHSLKQVGKEKINLMPLDDVIADEKMPLPHLVKIDVEGAELSVLRGSSKVLNAFATFILEYSESTSLDAGCRRERLLEFFPPGTYSVFGLLADENKIDLIPQHDFPHHSISNIIAVPKRLVKNFA